MANDLVRFSVAIPEDLLVQFDRFVAQRGIAKNRSEVVRDLIRDALIQNQCAVPGAEVIGTLTIAYNHHASDVQERLSEIQHHHLKNIISSTHVHLDAENCLEAIIIRGEMTRVRTISNMILGTKGVKSGGLVITTTGNWL